MASRIIVKNLPKHATETRLRDHFAECGEVTDCRLQKTRDGKTRQFAFIGFRKEEEAKFAIKRLSGSFFDTVRISVELAHAPGAAAPAVRPWSKYSVGSSAHARKNSFVDNRGDAAGKTYGKGKGKDKGEDKSKDRDKDQCERKKTDERKPKAKAKKTILPTASIVKSVQLAEVRPTKAGVANTRTKIEFDSDSDQSEGEYNVIGDDGVERKDMTKTGSGQDNDRRTGDLAFAEDVDDLAWMKSKTAKAASGKSVDREMASTASEAEDEVGDERADKEENEEEDNEEEEEEEEVQEDDEDEKMSNEDDKQKDAVEDKELQGNTMAVEPMPAPDASDTGRLYVTNLPYSATEDELTAHFEPLGEVASVHICKDENTLKSRGFAYISYVFPEIAVRAISELDGQSFQGRLIHVNAAYSRPEPKVDVEKLNVGDKSFKKRREAQKKKIDAKLPHTWNLLYVSANAAADAMSAQLGVAKSELVGRDADGAAVTAALGETYVIQQTKRWLQKEGISIDAFERTGTSLLGSKASEDVKRRDDTLIVKHLPADTSFAELRDRFGRFGELVKFSLAPSNTVAVVQYGESGHAKRAFDKLAFSRYKHVPLYLEWAPEGVFIEKAKLESGEVEADSAQAAVEEGEVEICSVFVKNLNFSTTDASLKAAFATCKGLRSVKVMRKKSATGSKAGAQSEGLSMGYGFLEFDNVANAKEALKRKQNFILDGHTLNLQVSERSASQRNQGAQRKGSRGKPGALSQPRICVRNLAFEANAKELRKLFGVYGTVTAVRLPKKGDYSGHRGFAFIDFLTKTDASAAMEALQHTHLYGRHMVIEPAEDQSTDVVSVQQRAVKREASKTAYGEATKRRRTAVLDTSGTQGTGDSFEDTFGAG